MMLKGCWFSLRPMVWDLFLTCGGERKTCRFCVFLGSLNVCRSAWFLHVVLGQPNQQLGWHVAEHERANYRCYHLSSGEASYPAYSMLFNVFFGTVKHAQLQVSVLTYSHTDGQWRRSVLGHRRDRKGCVRQHALGSRVQSLDFDWALIKTYQDFLFDEPFQCFLYIVYCASNSSLWPWLGMNWSPSEISLGHADTEHC